MTACERLRPQAAGIAALAPDDPERLEYLEHAAGCASCMRALGQAEEVLRILDRAPRPAPAPSALQRASRQILSELTWLSRQPAVRAGAVVAGWVLLVFLARGRAADGWLSSVLLAAAAALIAAFAKSGAGAAASFLLAAGFALWFGRPDGLSPGTGIECFLLEQVCAIIPAAAVFWLVRKTGAGAPQALIPAVVAGALAGEAALHLTCPARHSAAHLWVFHFGGVVVAALWSLLWSRRITARPSAKEA